MARSRSSSVLRIGAATAQVLGAALILMAWCERPGLADTGAPTCGQCDCDSGDDGCHRSGGSGKCAASNCICPEDQGCCDSTQSNCK
jgi:hypothetical protein